MVTSISTRPATRSTEGYAAKADHRGLVHRYHTRTGVDGLPGDEGAFLLCTFWLAHAQALAVRTRAARQTFQRAAGYANDVGLLAEQVAPTADALLGNFPQAFSHIGLINAAWAISQAEQDHPAYHTNGGTLD